MITCGERERWEGRYSHRGKKRVILWLHKISVWNENGKVLYNLKNPEFNKKLGKKTPKHVLHLVSTRSWFSHFISVRSLSHVWLFVTPQTAASQASLSVTNSWNLLKLMSIESVMPSNHLILCCPLLLPPTFPSIRVFSSELVFHIRWPNLSFGRAL